MDVGEIAVDIAGENKTPVAEGSKGSKSKSKSDSKTKKSLSKSKKSALRRFTQKRAAKTVGKFINKTGSKRKAVFLNTICPDSGVCIAFGKERNKILDFFNGFTTFEYLKGVKAIGSDSVNGFVKELEYEHGGYKAYAILKSSRNKIADNLIYEYFVGLYLNKLAEKVPCFIETYGHFRYKPDRYFESDMFRENFKNEKPGFTDLKKILIPHEPGKIDHGNSCEDSINQCILIQHVKGAKTIADKVFKDVPDHDFIMNDFLYVIYQVYYALAKFSTVFTHYDLHPDNVVLYKPVEGKYIQFHYYLSPNEPPLSFKSQYIAKIIDYGRSYISTYRKYNSKTYYDKLCAIESCNYDNEECGDESGYGWLVPPPTKDNYYICSSVNNPSHDLRLLNDLFPEMPWNKEPFKSNLRIRSIIKNILGRIRYEDKYGTPPVTGKGYGPVIDDVADAEIHIRRAVLMADQNQANNDYYSGMEKLGDLHVYGNKPMKFIPAA